MRRIVGTLIALGALLIAGLLVSPAAAATLYISEFSGGLTPYGTGLAQLLPQPSLADQAVTFTTTTQSAAFNSKTHAVLLLCDAACSISFGASPTATTGNFKLPANTFIAFGVTPGTKVAVVTNP